MRWFFSLKVSKPRCTTRWEGPKKLYRCVYLEGKISLVDSWIIFKITTPFARSFDQNYWNCWSQDLGHLMFQNYCCFLENSKEILFMRNHGLVEYLSVFILATTTMLMILFNHHFESFPRGAYHLFPSECLFFWLKPRVANNQIARRNLSENWMFNL